MQDLLTAGGRVNLIERKVEPHEVGFKAAALKPDVLLRVYRQGTVVGYWDFQEGGILEAGDTLVLLRSLPRA